jgi:hypothetical protein
MGPYVFVLSGLPDGCVTPHPEVFFVGLSTFDAVLNFEVSCTPLPDA